LFWQLMRAAASRTFWTAGSNSPIKMAIMAITTSNSISVNADRLRNMRIHLREEENNEARNSDHRRPVPRAARGRTTARAGSAAGQRRPAGLSGEGIRRGLPCGRRRRGAGYVAGWSGRGSEVRAGRVVDGRGMALRQRHVPVGQLPDEQTVRREEAARQA